MKKSLIFSVLIGLAGTAAAGGFADLAGTAGGDAARLNAPAVPEPAKARPVYGAPRNNQQNMALRKLKMNPDWDAADNILIARVAEQADMAVVLRELAAGGFKVSVMSERTIAADVSGKNPGSEAVGLAKYYYITEVMVSCNVYSGLFPRSDKSVTREERQTLTMRADGGALAQVSYGLGSLAANDGNESYVYADEIMLSVTLPGAAGPRQVRVTLQEPRVTVDLKYAGGGKFMAPLGRSLTLLSRKNGGVVLTNTRELTITVDGMALTNAATHSDLFRFAMPYGD
ncbi:MAG: hypothetical protein M0011_00105 [Elusimicrobia bacterium]|nr:hypothetical protein [Elusimicrobiota bacterium]